MATDATTMLKDLIKVDAYDAMVTAQVGKKIRFTPLADVDTTLVGQEGDTKHFPAYEYMGDAEEVPEGEAIPLDSLTTTDKQVTIKSIGKGFSVTDQAVLSEHGDSMNEGTKQITTALAQKIDNDLMEAAKTTPQTVTFAATLEGLDAATAMFDDNAESDNVVIVALMSKKSARAIRREAREKMIGSEVGANAVIKGAIFDVDGVQLVSTKRLSDGEAIYIQTSTDPDNDEPGKALRLVMKQSAQTEPERDAQHRKSNVYAHEDYAAYLYDPSKVVYAKSGAEDPKA